MRVCVIGGGFAGLAAADSLASAGIDVVVLEAGTRLGGRVWSERLEGGGLIERGGEFITAGYDVTAELAARFDLPLDGMGISYPDRELEPDPELRREDVLAAAEEVAAAGLAKPGGAAGEVLAATVDDPEVRELFASRLQSATAFAFDRLEARWLAKVPSLLDDLETRRVRGGNQRLAEALDATLPQPAVLNARAGSIRIEGGGVLVKTSSDEIIADACVVAVPCTLVAEIEFEPHLPDDVLSALRSIRMSSAAKLAVPLHRAPSPRAVMSVPDRFWAWTTPCDEVGGRVVGSWAGSEPILHELDLSDGDPGRWLQRLGALWPELDMDEAAALLTIWDSDSWSRGAYSVLAGADSGPLNAGSDRIVFAGEHTAAEWSGTMEGALRSGRRAAADVLISSSPAQALDRSP